MSTDHRFTWGLIIDVLHVLERHGYQRHDDEHTGHAIGVIDNLAHTYEGSLDTSYRPYPDRHRSPQDPGPGQRAPDLDQDAVVLTRAEIPAVRAALNHASGYTRSQAEACTACTDRSCPACDTRLKDAHAYDQIVARMLGAGRAPDVGSFEPQLKDPAPDTDRAGDREAGQ